MAFIYYKFPCLLPLFSVLSTYSPSSDPYLEDKESLPKLFIFLRYVYLNHLPLGQWQQYLMFPWYLISLLALQCERDGKNLRWLYIRDFNPQSWRMLECMNTMADFKLSDFRNALGYFWKGENCLLLKSFTFWLIVSSYIIHSPIRYKEFTKRSSGLVSSLANKETQRSWERW